MKIIKKTIIISLISLFVISILLLGVLAVAIKNLDIDKYKTLLFENIQKTSGYGLYAEKISAEPSFKPYLPVNVHHFMVYSPNGQKLFKAKDIDFKISLLPLLKKQVRI